MNKNERSLPHLLRTLSHLDCCQRWFNALRYGILTGIGDVMKLSDKMEAFCREYVQDLNATQAAIRAGYSARSSQMQGSRLMSNDIVKQRIQQLMDQRSMRTNITADTVLERINRIADRAEDKGDYTSALKANELLGKHLKLFTDKVEHSGKIGLEDLIAGTINDKEK